MNMAALKVEEMLKPKAIMSDKNHVDLEPYFLSVVYIWHMKKYRILTLLTDSTQVLLK